MTRDMKDMTTKEYMREVCYGERYSELSNIIVSIKDKEPNETNIKLLDLFCRMSKDLFEIERRLES